MEPLRWILLLIGAVLIGAIYWFGRRHEGENPGEGLFKRARRAVRREERGGDPADTPRRPVEPDLDLGDLEAHGFDVEARPGTSDGSATQADHSADTDAPHADGSPSDEPDPLELDPVPPRAEPAGVADSISEPGRAPGPREPAAGAGGTDGAGEADEPPPVVSRPSREPAARPSPDAPSVAPPDAADGPDARPNPAVDDSPETAREPTSEPVGGRPTEDTYGDGRDRGGAPADHERVVVLHVVAQAGERLVGSRLRDALERNGLRHGALDIFHASDSEGSTVFSAANAIEPGTFDRTTMDTLTTPGIALFMQVPGPQSAETVFDRMLSTARAVADELDARVLDESHSTLTRQTEQHLREELRLLDRTARMSHHGSR